MEHPVKIGLLGASRIAREAILTPAAETSTVQVIAVAARSGDRARAFAEANGVPRAYEGYAALIADPEVEVVYNALPNSLHAEWSITAARAGKTVLCEKPLAASAAQARSMTKAARLAGAPLIEAVHYRHHPMAKAMIAKLKDGVIGEVRELRAILRIPRQLLAPDDIRFRLDLAGGAAMDLGVYEVNLLRAVMGEEPTVAAARANLVAPNVDGAMEASLAFPSGAQGVLACSLIDEEAVSRFEARGTRGELVAINPFLPQFRNRLTIARDGVTTAERFERTTTYRHQIEALVSNVRAGATILTPGEDGARTMSVLDAIYTVGGLGPRA